MKLHLNLMRLPDLTTWSRRQVAKVNTGGMIFATGLFVVGLALIPQVERSAQALEPSIPKLPLSGTIDRPLSGNAFELDGRPVQLWGIASPVSQTAQGASAQAYLSALVGSHPLVCLDTGHRTYDRLVVRCMDPWGRDVADLMVRGGWAYDEAAWSGGRYAAAENEARQLGMGLFRGAPLAEPLATAGPAGTVAPVAMLPDDVASSPYIVPRLIPGSVR